MSSELGESKEIEAAKEALISAGISQMEDCGCCYASIVYMARKARDKIRILNQANNKHKG